MVRTQGPVNLGLACRLCANLGLDDVVLVDPLCERDVKEARMFANKAREKLLALPLHNHVSEAVADCDLVIGTTARQRDADWGTCIDVDKVESCFGGLQARRVAIVFGNEADGLNNEELGLCQFFLTLPTWSDYYSYNLTHAMAIALYHCKKALKPLDKNDEAILATQKRRDQLYDYWLKSLDDVGYFTEHKEQWRRKLFARLFQRLPLTDKDCDLIRGMLAHYEKGKTD